MWTIDFSIDAERDLELVAQHLFDAYRAFGESGYEAYDHAETRVNGLVAAIHRLVDTPFIGTLRPDLLPDLRYLRRDGAAIWFVPVEERETILVLAIFFGPQDHTRRMLARLLGDIS